MAEPSALDDLPIRHDELVRQSTGAWWDAAINSVRQHRTKDARNALSRTDFICVHRLLYSALQAEANASNFDEQEADAWAQEDWERGCRGGATMMSRDDFEEVLLDVAAFNLDLATASPEDVSTFFLALLDRTGAPQRGGLLWGIQPDVEERRAHSYGVATETRGAFDPPPAYPGAETHGELHGAGGSRGASRERPPELLPDDPIPFPPPAGSGDAAGSGGASPRELLAAEEEEVEDDAEGDGEGDGEGEGMKASMKAKLKSASMTVCGCTRMLGRLCCALHLYLSVIPLLPNAAWT